MAKLTSKERSALPDSAFALPGRKYIICDKPHARAALARAAEGLSKGWLTKGQHDQIVKEAKEVLGESE